MAENDDKSTKNQDLEIEQHTANLDQASQDNIGFVHDTGMYADGINENLIDTVSSVGYLVDGLNWVFTPTPLHQEKPFLGHEHIHDIITNLYEGYFKLFGYEGSNVPVTERDKTLHKAGEVTGEVMAVVLPAAAAYQMEKAAVMTGRAGRETVRKAAEEFAKSSGGAAGKMGKTVEVIADTAKLSNGEMKRVMARASKDLPFAMRELVEAGKLDEAKLVLQKIATKGPIAGHDIAAMETFKIPKELLDVANAVSKSEIRSWTLANTFNRMGRTLSFVWEHPTEVLKDVWKSGLSAVGDVAAEHKIVTTGIVATGGAALDLSTGGHVTEMAANAADSRILHGVVNITNPDRALPSGYERTSDGAIRAESPEAETAKTVTDTVHDVTRTAGKAWDKTKKVLNLDSPAGPDSDDFSMVNFLKSVPGLGWLGYLIEFVGKMYDEYVKPIFTSADKGDLLVQGKSDRVARVAAQSGYALNDSDGTVELVSHAGGDPEKVRLAAKKQISGYKGPSMEPAFTGG